MIGLATLRRGRTLKYGITDARLMACASRASGYFRGLEEEL
ncbi:hypothetical protein [Arthrobacter methylotrophus]